MKFIGQFIQSLVARFRNDVYLEDISTGTIASGGNLGLDANNKIVKADTESGELSITNASDNRVVTSTGGTGLNAESTFTYGSETLTINSTSSTKPTITLLNTNADENAPSFVFFKVGASPADNDTLGSIFYSSNNDAAEGTTYADIVTTIADASDGDESGKIAMRVVADGNLRNFIDGTGSSSDVVDVNIGYGTGSTTTVAGSLFLGGSDGTPHTFGLNAHDNGNGGALTIRAGNATAGTSNADGGNLNFNAGLSTGGQFGGDFVFNTSYRGSAGSSLNSNFDIFKITPDLAGSGAVGFQTFGSGSSDDFFFVTVGNNGITSLGTFDADAALADLNILVDGDLTETCVNHTLDASGSITLDSGGGVSFFENGVSRYRFLVDSTPEVDITGDFTIDCTGNVEINADGGSIDFKDGTAQLAKIDSSGLSLTDSTSAGITFEGVTDDDHQITLKGGEPTADRVINLPDATGTVALNNISYHHITASFFDTLGTTAHYIPLGDSTSEVTSDLNTLTDWIAPCETTVDSIIMRMTNITATANITFTVQKDAVGSSSTSDVESETLSVTSTSEHDVLYFSFDSATIAKGETLKIKIQCASSMTSNTNHFVRVNLIMNWNDRYTGSSQIFTS